MEQGWLTRSVGAQSSTLARRIQGILICPVSHPPPCLPLCFLFGIMLRMQPATETPAAQPAPRTASRRARPAAAAQPAPTAPLNPFILTKKTVFMQRISDLVRTGHNHYVQGVIPLEKAGFLAAKFEQRFHVQRNKLEASRARKRGEHSARLLFWLPDESLQVHWILLFSPGSVIDDSEKWRYALSDRIQITGYELVRLTKPGADHPAWTWRYTRNQYELLRTAVVLAIRRKRDDELRQLIHTLWRSPGFAGTRAQVKKVADVIRAEWKRTRGKNETMPEIPTRLGYVRRLADTGLPWSELMKARKKE